MPVVNVGSSSQFSCAVWCFSAFRSALCQCSWPFWLVRRLAALSPRSTSQHCRNRPARRRSVRTGVRQVRHDTGTDRLRFRCSRCSRWLSRRPRHRRCKHASTCLAAKRFAVRRGDHCDHIPDPMEPRLPVASSFREPRPACSGGADIVSSSVTRQSLRSSDRISLSRSGYDGSGQCPGPRATENSLRVRGRAKADRMRGSLSVPWVIYRCCRCSDLR